MDFVENLSKIIPHFAFFAELSPAAYFSVFD